MFDTGEPRRSSRSTAATARNVDVPPTLQVLLASPRGFCAGVRRAIDAVRDALRVHGSPVYVRRAIVHNRSVVRQLEAEGAIFVQELEAVPEGAVIVLSAHGVPPAVAREAERRGLVAYDAVCPLVAKIHREVERHHRQGRHVVLVGHAGHPEILGTLGHLPDGAATLISSPAEAAALPFPPDRPLGLAVQTTYSVEVAAEVAAALASRFHDIAQPSTGDICYATTNRQAAVATIAARADAMIMVGERFSSNACRLAEVAAAAGCSRVQLIAEAQDIDWTHIRAPGPVGISAAASTPEASVEAVLAALGERFSLERLEGEEPTETVQFRRVAIG
jgi:4-hydroxy-3-methylbut-2-enyl diphosphate reductase